MLLFRARVRDELTHPAGRTRDPADRVERPDEVALAILRSERFGDENVPLSKRAAAALYVVHPDNPAAAIEQGASIGGTKPLRLLDGDAALWRAGDPAGNFRD